MNGVKLIVATLFAGTMVAAMPAAMAQSSAALARDDIRSTADCVVENFRHQATDLLATLPGSPEENRVARRFNTAFTACLGGDRHLADSDLAGARAAIAVALVASDTSHTPRAGTPWYLGAATGRSAYSGYDPKRLGALEFGSCIMAAAPDASVALVRAEPGSAAERQAIDALRPVIAPCMTHDTTVRLKADDLRTVLAEPIYHAMAR